MCVCVGNVNITLYCYFLKGEDLALLDITPVPLSYTTLFLVYVFEEE
jgi:hypothetical protein